MEIINLGEADGLPPVDWAAVAEKLDAGSAPQPDAANSRTTWLSTINEDGSPHVTAVGALWVDGTFWFQTGAGTRKGRNVARDPRRGRGDRGRRGAGNRAGRGSAHCEGMGGPGLAGGARRERTGHHCPVQRTVARTTAVERVPHRATLGDRGLGGGAGRPDPLPLLTLSGSGGLHAPLHPRSAGALVSHGRCDVFR